MASFFEPARRMVWYDPDLLGNLPGHLLESGCLSNEPLEDRFAFVVFADDLLPSEALIGGHEVVWHVGVVVHHCEDANH